MALGTLELNVAANVDGAISGLNSVSSAANKVEGAGGNAAGGLSSINESSNSASGALGGLSSQENKTSKGLMKLGPKGMAAGAAVAGFAAMAAGAVAAGKALSAMMKDAAAEGDRIDKTSTRLGVTTDELQKLEFAAGQSGVGLSTLEKAMGRSDKSIEDMADSVSGASSYQDALNIATEEYGDRLGREMLPMLMEGSEGLEEMGDDAEELGGVMSGDSVKASVAFTDALDRLDTMMEGVRNTIGAAFLPAAAEMVNIVVEIGQQFRQMMPAGEGIGKLITEIARNGMVAFLQGAQQMIQRTGDIAESLLPASKMISRVGTMIAGAVQGFMAWQKAIDMVRKVIVSFATKAIGGLVDALSDLLGLASDVIDSIPSIGPLAVPGVESLSSALGSASEAADGASQAITNIADDGLDSAERDLEDINERLDSLKDTFGADVSDEIESVLRGIASGSEEADRRLGELIESIGDGDFSVELEEAREDARAAGGVGDDDDDDDDDDGASDAGDAGGAGDDDDDDDEGRSAALRDENELTERQLELLQLKLALLQEEDETENLRLQKRREELELEERIDELKEEELTEAQEILEIEILTEESKKRQEELQAQINEAKDKEDEAQTSINDHLENGLSILGNMQGVMASFVETGSDAETVINGIGSALQNGIGGAQSLVNGIHSAVTAQELFNASTNANPYMAIASGVLRLGGAISSLVSMSKELSEEDDDAMDQEEQNEDMARKFAEAFADEQERRLGRPVQVNVDARGALVGEENEIARKLTDMVEEESNNRVRRTGSN